MGLLTAEGGGKKAYPTHILQIMKLSTGTPYIKKIQKIYESLDTPLEFY